MSTNVQPLSSNSYKAKMRRFITIDCILLFSCLYVGQLASAKKDDVRSRAMVIPTRRMPAFVHPRTPPTRRVEERFESLERLLISTNTAMHTNLSRRRYPSSSTLQSKKKGRGGTQGGPPASKKVQVKLLKQVAGTGQKGDVVLVTPAFFQNKLRPTKSAEIISDDDVEKERAEAAALEKDKMETAEKLKEQIESLELVLSRKAGPDGQLFGGVGAKVIMEELKKKVVDKHDNEFLEGKGVKIQALMDVDGKKMRGDIKHTGEFKSTISLTREVSAKFKVVIHPQD